MPLPSPARILAAACAALLLAAAPAAAQDDAALVARARAIHARVLTLDTHVDISPAAFRRDAANYVSGVERNQVDVPKMEAGGLDAVFLIVYTGQRGGLDSAGYAAAYAAAMEKFAAIHRLTDSLAPDRVGLALTAADARRIHASGRRVIFIGVENGFPIGTDLSRIQQFADLGARYLSLAHNGHSQLSDSNTGERDGVWMHNGLSPLGRDAIKELNTWGIMIDISHPSKQSMMQTLALTQAPIIASHSGVRAICDHSRNLDDEQLQGIKRNNGVVQLVAFNSYVKCGPAVDGVPPAERKRATVKDYVDHIDYVVKLIGVDHAGISSDFDGGGGVDGWSNASETFNVTLELVRRGYSEADIAKIWSGNLLRVLTDVQAVAARLQAAK
jgi:membrane dipeptidase